MMAYKDNAIIARLDRVAVAMVGRGAETGMAPRLSILANLVFLVSGVGGMAVVAQGETGPGLLFANMFGSTAYTLILAYKRRGNTPLDERERDLFWKAMAIGALVPSVMVAVWALLLGPFADQGMWYPDQASEWQGVGFFILGLITQITNIASAWMTPAYAAELDEEE